MKRILSYMGAALIMVGLVSPVTAQQPAPVAHQERTVQVSEVKEETITAPASSEATVAEPEPVVEEEPAPAPVAPAPAGHEQCVAWLQELKLVEINYAIELQSRENMSCDPNLYNQQGSDACGVAQELPCGKSGCGMPPNADGQCQIRWMHGYVMSRYGSWQAALNHHNRNGWY